MPSRLILHDIIIIIILLLLLFDIFQNRRRAGPNCRQSSVVSCRRPVFVLVSCVCPTDRVVQWSARRAARQCRVSSLSRGVSVVRSSRIAPWCARV